MPHVSMDCRVKPGNDETGAVGFRYCSIRAALACLRPRKMMTSDTQKTKANTAPKKDAPAKVETTTAKEASKPEAGKAAAPAPSSYSRGEGQKPVTAAYKDNWNAIFAKKSGNKNTKKKKR